jgi:hypothetical protein
VIEGIGHHGAKPVRVAARCTTAMPTICTVGLPEDVTHITSRKESVRAAVRLKQMVARLPGRPSTPLRKHSLPVSRTYSIS